LRPGAEVRYAGGPPVGRIEDVRTDAHDTARMEITFRVKPDIPVKTDSKAAISSNSPLSDNFLQIVPGSNAAQRAPSGSTSIQMNMWALVIWKRNSPISRPKPVCCWTI